MALWWRPANVGQTFEANILAQSQVTSKSTSSYRFQALPTTTMVAYVKLIRDILQAKVGVENKTTLTVRLDGVSNQLLMKRLARTIYTMHHLVMRSSTNCPIDTLEFDLNAPCSMLEFDMYESERGTALYDPYIVSLSAWLFNELLHPEGPGRLDILLRLHDNIDETAMTMTVKYTRADRRFECLAPLAMDHYTGLLALV